ncbi:MAG: glycosyltransferase family 4 protein [Bacteroidota bacterium]
MKILQVHNLYRIPGGEDVVVEAEKSLLEAKGHHVVQLTKNNTDIRGLKKKVSLLFQTHYNPKAKVDLLETLRAEQPDVAHVHNFFPLFSPSIFESFAEFKVPCVMTLHNYRLLHPNGLMLHNGRLDLRSLNGSAYNCVIDGVYRSSIIQTAVVAHMIEYHRSHRTWNNQVNRFIALSFFARDVFVKGGIPDHKIVVKPNYLPSYLSHSPLPADQRKGFIYIGRISEEKGLAPLLEHWASYQTQELHIVGDGPLLEPLMNRFKNNHITWYGRLGRTASLELLSNCKALLFPSICYENFPMTILEAFARGIPVISNNFGSHGSLITHGKNGYLYSADQPDQLTFAVDLLSKNPDILNEVSGNAYSTYQSDYTDQANYDQLMSIYESIL